MQHHPEYIRPSEMLRPEYRADTASSNALSPEHLAHIFLLRESQLSAIGHAIAQPLREALEKKVAYERAKLQEIADTHTQHNEEKKRLSARLKAEYFVLQPLEVDLI